MNDGVEEVAERAKEEVKGPGPSEAKGRRGLKSDWTNLLSTTFKWINHIGNWQFSQAEAS